MFDTRSHTNSAVVQPIKVEIESDGVIPANINGYALVLPSKLVSVSSAGQKRFDII